MGVAPFPFDPILPTQYLDFDALKIHKILKGKIHDITYNLLFNQTSVVHTYLPAPALFDYHSRGRILFWRTRLELTMQQWRQHGGLRHQH